MELQSWTDRIKWTPPPAKLRMKPRKSQNASFSHLCLKGGGGGVEISQLILSKIVARANIEDDLAEYLTNYS